MTDTIHTRTEQQRFVVAETPEDARRAALAVLVDETADEDTAQKERVFSDRLEAGEEARSLNRFVQPGSNHRVFTVTMAVTVEGAT